MTSGNMGAGLAVTCAVLEHPLIVTMSRREQFGAGHRHRPAGSSSAKAAAGQRSTRP
jgi:hypothetical protein